MYTIDLFMYFKNIVAQNHRTTPEAYFFFASSRANVSVITSSATFLGQGL